MRVIVTGGRDFDQKAFIWLTLDRVQPAITTLVHGACPSGADYWADKWAEARSVPVERHPARWALGKKAGPLRNKEMAERGADLCVAFPGGRGTANCTSECRKMGIQIQEANFFLSLDAWREENARNAEAGKVMPPPRYDDVFSAGTATLSFEPPAFVPLQEPPEHPVWEATEKARPDQVVSFLCDENLPADMSFAYRGNLYHFRTREERLQFMFGFEAAWQLSWPSTSPT